MIRRGPIVYFVLALTWLVIVAWQAVEHYRVRQAAHQALINRSRDITTTLGLVIRSQRHFFSGVIFQDRIESALKELVKAGELNSVELLNASGEMIASAGAAAEDPKSLVRAGERWQGNEVWLFNPVDLGTNAAAGPWEPNPPTIVLNWSNRPPPFIPPLSQRTNRPRSGPERGRGFQFPAERRPLPGPRAGPFPPPPPREGTNRPRWRPPPIMPEKEYRALVQHRGVHGLLLSMSSESVRQATLQDLWLRLIIGGFATVAVLGVALAWENLAKSAELEMRLLKARELNAHLKEMNLAAAGLAHETRNPLNIIRGLAQLISKEEEASAEIRKKSRDIIDETDRVTAQLTEFINYSRPLQIRPRSLSLPSVASEVARALSYDLDEKKIELQIEVDPLIIEADEQLLRQALFNLALNSIQAVPPEGQITIRGQKINGEAFLEISDNGPGVAPENRTEIFKPYFTTHQTGTGLGLAVVAQIVLAHSWEIECLDNPPHGARFRITHIKAAVAQLLEHAAL